MKISLNWLKKYVKVPESVSDEELIRLIGARLVEVEGVIDETHKYDNIYIVRVESCERIPETHLSRCLISAGHALTGDGSLAPVVTGLAPSTSVVTSGSPLKEHDPALIQVVCGAPNVHAGMLAVWIAPGAVVPASVHEDAPFVIGKRKMQGYESNGMLAGADELDFGDDHSGIVEIDPEMAKPGDLLADVFDLKDKILEIENKSLTHRPDCFGIIGFAREVSGILGLDFQDCKPSFLDSRPLAQSFLQHFTQSSPRSSRQLARTGCSLDDFTRLGREKVDKNDIGSGGRLSKKDSIAIFITDPNICQRYSAVVMAKHGEITKKYLTWVDTVLSKSGMKSISPIVDATNYLMLLTGQPLHAFDYDKFVAVSRMDKPEIRVRLAQKEEKLVLLDDTEVILNEDDIVICSGDIPVALAGAMGGKSTMIDENTRNIILESATFSLYNLRKTQMAHGIFTEAITRFTKGQPPYQTIAVAEACADMLADGFQVVAVGDEYPKPGKEIVVKITTDEINSLLGTSYDKKLIVGTLENVGFRIAFDENLSKVATEGASNQSPKQMIIGVPDWRTDIHIKEDIIEEVGRLLGYDNIKPTLPLHATANKNGMWELKKAVRGLMNKFGANELLTYTFVSERLLRKAGLNEKNSYKIVNSISPELQYVRQSIVPSLLDKAYMNQKIPVDKFVIYEMNKVYQKEWGLNDEDVPVEKMQLGAVIAERKGTGIAYYKAKMYVAKMLREFNISPKFFPVKSKNAEVLPFEPKRAAEVWVNDEYVGVVGEFKNSVRNEFKLAPYLAGFEINMDTVTQQMSRKKQIDLRKKEKRDLTVTTNNTYGELVDRIGKILDECGAEAEIKPSGIYQPEGASEKNITVHLEFTKYVEGVMEKLEKL